MATTIRKCLMCQSEMQCTRASKLLCSNVCHSKMHKQRTKLDLSNAEMIQNLKAAQLTINQPTTIEEQPND